MTEAVREIQTQRRLAQALTKQSPIYSRTSSSDSNKPSSRAEKASRNKVPVSADSLSYLNLVITLLGKSISKLIKEPELPNVIKQPTRYTSMHSYIQILTTPTADSAGTLMMLHFDKQRYLIGNFVEGTERMRAEINVSWRSVNNMFVTGSMKWATVSGLLGVLMSMADRRMWVRKGSNNFFSKEVNVLTDPAAHSKLKIFGPPCLDYFLALNRHFAFKRGLPVDITAIRGNGKSEVTPSSFEPSFDDGNIKVWTMAISSDEKNQESARFSSSAKRKYQDLVGSDAPESGIDDPLAKEVKLTGEDKNMKDSTEEHEEISLAEETAVSASGEPSVQGSEANDSEMVSDSARGHKRKRSYQPKKSSEHITDGINPKTNQLLNSNSQPTVLEELPLSEVEMPAEIFVRDKGSSKIASYTGPVPGGREPLPNVKVMIRKPWPSSRFSTLPQPKVSRDAVSYIIKNQKQRGKFRPDLADKLGLKAIERGMLTRGHDVVTSEGKVVTPDMVIGQGREGRGVVVIDLPTSGHVESLVNRPEFSNKKIMDSIESFIWILGAGVSTHPTLQKFISGRKQFKHVVSSPDCCPNRLIMNCASAATIQYARMDPKRFSVPQYENTATPQKSIFAPSEQSGSTPITEWATPAEIGMKLQLEPKVKIQKDSIQPPLDIETVKRASPNQAERLGEQAREVVRRDTDAIEKWRASIPSPDTEIITLGTGSAAPSKYRNVSATLVRVPGYGSYLLDCGEGTLGQLQRLYTLEQLSEILRDLRMVWISHRHCDHHLGLISLLKAWYQENHGSIPDSVDHDLQLHYDLTSGEEDKITQQKSLAIIAEDAFFQFLYEYTKLDDIGLSRVLLLHSPPPWENSEPTSSTGISPLYLHDTCNDIKTPGNLPLARSSYEELFGFSGIDIVYVDHCRHARAVALTFPTGLKVAFSGDCRPSKAFARLASGATVLIHEATFEDEMRKDARLKKHSTTTEALKVGAAMGAKAVVLTHFSQRYSRMPVLEDGMKENDASVDRNATTKADAKADGSAALVSADADGDGDADADSALRTADVDSEAVMSDANDDIDTNVKNIADVLTIKPVPNATQVAAENDANFIVGTDKIVTKVDVDTKSAIADTASNVKAVGDVIVPGADSGTGPALLGANTATHMEVGATVPGPNSAPVEEDVQSTLYTKMALSDIDKDNSSISACADGAMNVDSGATTSLNCASNDTMDEKDARFTLSADTSGIDSHQKAGTIVKATSVDLFTPNISITSTDIKNIAKSGSSNNCSSFKTTKGSLSLPRPGRKLGSKSDNSRQIPQNLPAKISCPPQSPSRSPVRSPSISATSSSLKTFSLFDVKGREIPFIRPPDMKVCVAFDCMRVRLGDIVELEKYMPALIELGQIESSALGVTPLQVPRPTEVRLRDSEKDKPKEKEKEEEEERRKEKGKQNKTYMQGKGEKKLSAKAKKRIQRLERKEMVTGFAKTLVDDGLKDGEMMNSMLYVGERADGKAEREKSDGRVKAGVKRIKSAELIEVFNEAGTTEEIQNIEEMEGDERVEQAEQLDDTEQVEEARHADNAKLNTAHAETEEITNRNPTGQPETAAQDDTSQQANTSENFEPPEPTDGPQPEQHCIGSVDLAKHPEVPAQVSNLIESSVQSEPRKDVSP